MSNESKALAKQARQAVTAKGVLDLLLNNALTIIMIIITTASSRDIITNGSSLTRCSSEKNC